LQLPLLDEALSLSHKSGSMLLSKHWLLANKIDAFCMGVSMSIEEASLLLQLQLHAASRGARTCLEWVIKGVLIQGVCAVEQSDSHNVWGVLQTQYFKVHPLSILTKVHQLQWMIKSL